MILTLTGNLLAESTFDFATWAPGRVQRALAETFQVGGKGINVAKMLHRLGVPTTALGFAGGSSGDACLRWLARQSWRVKIFPSSRPTRSGLVVRAPDRITTTFLGSDIPPSPRALRACADFLSARRDPAEVLAFCGSFPGWEERGCASLRVAVAAWAVRAPLVVDSHGPPLAWLVAQPVRLVKINREEFDVLHPPAPGTAARDLASRLRQAQLRWPTPAWIVTDGSRPVWFAAPGATPACLKPPAIKEVSATGSGDVFLAGVLHALFVEHRPLADAVARALPLAAANAASATIADFTLPRRH